MVEVVPTFAESCDGDRHVLHWGDVPGNHFRLASRSQTCIDLRKEMSGILFYIIDAIQSANRILV